MPQGKPPATRWSDCGDRYELSAGQVTLRVYKAPLRFALYQADGTRLWAESRGISWNGTATTQTPARGADEQFYGTGEQNGSGNTSRRGRTLEVGVDYDRNEGGHPNSVPFCPSSVGYGVYRNTYAPGTYAFTGPVTTTEQENRFDAYYFAGGTAKDVIGAYTKLTGRPMLPPVYGLEAGDSDCYPHDANRGERHTLDALKVADDYVKNDTPLGWMLVNDGYGCGYEDRAGPQLPQGADGSVDRGRDGDGHPLTLNGTAYAKGIGVHADSDIGFWLGGRCASLTATAGVDDEIDGYGGVSFPVVADGRTVWSSPTVSGSSGPLPVDVPPAGARHVHLVVTDTDGTKSGDHGDWAEAEFHCAA